MVWLPASGRGWVVLPIYIFVALGFIFVEGLLGLERGTAARAFAVNATFFLVAAPLLFLGARWKRNGGRLVWDARRQRLTRLPGGHTFLWLEVQVWGWIFCALGAAKLMGLT